MTPPVLSQSIGATRPDRVPPDDGDGPAAVRRVAADRDSQRPEWQAQFEMQAELEAKRYYFKLYLMIGMLIVAAFLIYNLVHQNVVISILLAVWGGAYRHSLALDTPNHR